MRPITSFTGLLKVPETLLLNSIGSIITRLLVKLSAALLDTINTHLDKRWKAFKAVFLNFSNHVKGYSVNSLLQVPLLDDEIGSQLLYWSQTIHLGT